MTIWRNSDTEQSSKYFWLLLRKSDTREQKRQRKKHEIRKGGKKKKEGSPFSQGLTKQTRVKKKREVLNLKGAKCQT